MAATSAGPPIAGAYMVWNATADDVGSSESVVFVFALPTGMSATIIGVSTYANANTGSTIVVGTTGTANGILTSVTPTADTVAYAVPNGSLAVSGRVPIAAGGNLKVTITGGTSAEGVAVAIYGYVTAHATNIQPD